MQAVEEMGVSHGGGASLQPSLSDSEGSSEDDETEGGPTSQDNAAVLETGMESRRTLCSTQSRTTSDKLSELQPSCSSSITGVLSQDEGRRVPSETSSSLLLTVEPPDHQDAGQNNEGLYQDGGLSVQKLQKGDGEVGGSGGGGGGEEDSGTDEDEDSEGSSTFPSPAVGLQTSLQTQAHQPSRDKRTDSKSSSPTATSYMQGDQTRIRQLVKRTVAKKRKQQKQRQQPKPKKDTASAAARRSKKSSRRAVRQDDFW